MARNESECPGDARAKQTPTVRRSAYSTWEQVAGYFDGDGTVSISITRFGFAIELVLVDNYKPLLEHIASFLLKKGFFSTFFFHKSNGRSSWRLRVKRKEDVIGVLSSVLLHLDKKREETKAAIEYLTDRIDGVEFARRINNQVKIGERVGKRLLPEDLHFLKSEGKALGQRRAAATRRSQGRVTPEVAERIVRDYRECGTSQRNLAKVYGVSQSWISRIICRCHNV